MTVLATAIHEAAQLIPTAPTLLPQALLTGPQLLAIFGKVEAAIAALELRARGAHWLRVTAQPDDARDGEDGDLALNTSNGDVWAKDAGAWAFVLNLKPKGTGTATPGGAVDAYTKTESDLRFATVAALQQLKTELATALATKQASLQESRQVSFDGKLAYTLDTAYFNKHTVLNSPTDGVVFTLPTPSLADVGSILCLTGASPLAGAKFGLSYVQPANPKSQYPNTPLTVSLGSLGNQETVLLHIVAQKRDTPYQDTIAVYVVPGRDNTYSLNQLAAQLAALGGRFRGPWAAGTHFNRYDIVIRPDTNVLAAANANFTSGGTFVASDWMDLPQAAASSTGAAGTNYVTTDTTQLIAGSKTFTVPVTLRSAGIAAGLVMANNSGAGNTIQFQTNNTITGQFRADQSGNLALDSAAAGFIDFNYYGGTGGVRFWRGNNASPTDRVNVLFTNSGEVGIGVNTPTEKLEVAGNAKANKFIGAFFGDGAGITGLPFDNYLTKAAFNAFMGTNPADLDTFFELRDQVQRDTSGLAGLLATQQQHTQQLLTKLSGIRGRRRISAGSAAFALPVETLDYVANLVDIAANITVTLPPITAADGGRLLALNVASAGYTVTLVSDTGAGLGTMTRGQLQVWNVSVENGVASYVSLFLTRADVTNSDSVTFDPLKNQLTVAGLFQGVFTAGKTYQANDSVISPSNTLVYTKTKQEAAASYNAALWFDYPVSALAPTTSPTPGTGTGTGTGTASTNFYATLPDLLAAALIDRQVYYTAGYAAVNDGGGAMYYYDATSDANPNAGTIVVVPGKNGRLVLVVQRAVSAKHFGAKFDGNTDDTAALQTAFTWVISCSGRLELPSGSAKTTAPLTLGLTEASNYKAANDKGPFGEQNSWEIVGAGLIDNVNFGAATKGTQIRLYGTGHKAIVQFNPGVSYHARMSNFSLICDTKGGAEFGLLFDSTKFSQHKFRFLASYYANRAYGILANGGENGEFTTWECCTGVGLTNFFYMNKGTSGMPGESYGHRFTQCLGAVDDGGFLVEIGDGSHGYNLVFDQCNLSGVVPGDTLRGIFDTMKGTYLLRNKGASGTITFNGGRNEDLSGILYTTLDGLGGSAKILIGGGIHFDGFGGPLGVPSIKTDGQDGNYTVVVEDAKISGLYGKYDQVFFSTGLSLGDESAYIFRNVTFENIAPAFNAPYSKNGVIDIDATFIRPDGKPQRYKKRLGAGRLSTQLNLLSQFGDQAQAAAPWEHFGQNGRFVINELADENQYGRGTRVVCLDHLAGVTQTVTVNVGSDTLAYEFVARVGAVNNGGQVRFSLENPDTGYVHDQCIYTTYNDAVGLFTDLKLVAMLRNQAQLRVRLEVLNNEFGWLLYQPHTLREATYGVLPALT